MNPRIAELVERMKALESELEQELDKTREDWHYRLVNKKVQFERGVLQQQKRLKENLFKYILTAHPKHLLVAPFIYAVFPAFVLLDLMVSLYHAVCFPILGIPRVKRSDHFSYDRSRLAYLNLLEILNCAYCSYGNGLVSYVREIVARTEQYWCPIKHAGKYVGVHSRYEHFAEFGDAEGYRRDLDKIRKDFQD
jgi:hypothetical protein